MLKHLRASIAICSPGEEGPNFLAWRRGKVIKKMINLCVEGRGRAFQEDTGVSKHFRPWEQQMPRLGSMADARNLRQFNMAECMLCGGEGLMLTWVLGLILQWGMT